MLTMRFPGGLPKALTLSYDDGVEQDRQLLSILDEAGIKCTFNLNSGLFSPEGFAWPQGHIHRRMSRSGVKSTYHAGHEVAVHTLTHPDLTRLPLNEITREILEDRKNLEALFGTLVRGAAYPYGTFSDKAVEALKACGIVYCRTVWSSHDFSLPQDWLRLRPTCHHADPQLEALCDRFLADQGSFGSRLFYLWGHAYEFEQADNWQVMQRFAQKMQHHKDIWYCTNIEVYDYCAAWDQLQISADGNMVHNPTATPLWFEAGREDIRCIQPGETLSLR